MPEQPRKDGNVRLPKELINRIRTQAKRKEMTQIKLIEELIKLQEVHDLLRDDWDVRLTAALKKGMWHLAQQKHFENKKRCDALRAGDEKWKCIHGRYQKTPMIRILAECYEASLRLCEGCEVTLAPILLNYELQGKIQQLENKLEARAGVTFKAPVCNRGAVLTADGNEFRSCPKRPSAKTVSVYKFCKVLSNGLPCQLYAEIPISVADRESQVNLDL